VTELIAIIFVNVVQLFEDDLVRWTFSKLIKEFDEKIDIRAKFTNTYDVDWSLISKIEKLKLKNLAFNSIVTQSSHFGSGLENHLGVCNGLKTGGFGFHTSLENNPWLLLDLRDSFVCYTIVCYNRLDAASDRISRLRCFCSSDGIDWKMIYEHDGRGPFGGVDSKIPPLIISFREGITLRYIKFDLNDYNYFHLDEVEIY
jgi:hypothetical protein